MIHTLRNFDNITAAGILARAAIALEDSINPAGTYEVPDEGAIRSNLLTELRQNIGINIEDRSARALELLSSALDAERENLLPASEPDEALKALARKGALPSDLYQISIDQGIANYHGAKFGKERQLIEQTVRSPGREQNFGPSEQDSSFLVSLFARYFPNIFPNRSFTMLLVCQRHELNLVVHQAWRIYPDSIELRGAETLVDMLERFAEKYGVEVELGDQRGHFIRTAKIPKNQSVTTTIKLPKERRRGAGRTRKLGVVVTSLVQASPLDESNQIALAIAIDLYKYKHYLKAHGY